MEYTLQMFLDVLDIPVLCIWFQSTVVLAPVCIVGNCGGGTEVITFHDSSGIDLLLT